MRLLRAALVYLASLFLTAVAAVFGVLALAGPHSDLLPKPLQILVYVVAWLVLLVLPAWVAVIAWRRHAPHPTPH